MAAPVLPIYLHLSTTTYRSGILYALHDVYVHVPLYDVIGNGVTWYYLLVRTYLLGKLSTDFFCGKEWEVVCGDELRPPYHTEKS